jgi:hypothetical protein
VTLHQPNKKCQRPSSSDRLAYPDFCINEYRVRRIAGQCRVSLATAETIVMNAGFSDGERRR